MKHLELGLNVMTVDGQTSVRVPKKDRRFFLDFVTETETSDLFRRENRDRMPFPQQIEVSFQLFSMLFNKTKNTDDVAVACY
jgi:hypothetical protein